MVQWLVPVENAYEKLRADAARLSEAEFAKRVGVPALLLERTGDWYDFDTQVVANVSDVEEDDEKEEAGPRLHLIVKSDRNPYADRISVGRAKTNDIVIRDSSVSKLHAHFLKIADGAVGIRDANSKNGVTVNGRRVGSSAPEPLKSGDLVQIGHVETHFFDPAALWARLRQP
jgi:hypothetical protein